MNRQIGCLTTPDGLLVATDGPEANMGEDNNAEDRLAHARVARILRRDLMGGRYQPGEVMTLRKLAAQFDVSPMPVRDALRQLVAERALEVINANRSVAVPHFDHRRLADIRRVRLEIEGLAAELAALNATDEQIEAIRQFQSDSERAGRGSQERNRDFHFAVYAASGSAVLMPLIESLWLQFGPYLSRMLALIEASFLVRDHHHREIIEAIARREPQRARKAMTEDIASAMDMLLGDEKRASSGRTDQGSGLA